MKVKGGDWVAAVYEGQWYIGQVLEVNEDDKDAKVSFLKATMSKPPSFKWPTVPDEIWVDFDHLLCVIQEPFPRGKSKRMFQFHENSITMVENRHDGWRSAKK